MNKKSLAIACVLAGAAFAASATVNDVGTDTSLGAIGYATDFTPNGDGTVTWAGLTNQPKGSYDVFSDTYDFTLPGSNGVDAAAQVVGANKSTYALTGNAGELQLYEGTYAAGSSLSSYTLLGQTSFDTGGESLSLNLAAGNYFFAVEGTTAGAKGGRYSFEVTAVPEPANAALLLFGLGLLATIAARRKGR